MTREEIIECLDSIVGTYEILLGDGINSDILDVDDIEAIKEAISALSENKADLISRQAVLDRTVNRNSIWNKITDSEGNNLEDILNSIPSSENKGKWIIYGFPSSEQIKNCTEDYYCSECKFVVSRFESRACNYCPNCGADMRGKT